MAKTYRNFAFISYKSQDHRWAEWLQRKLEYYRLPADIRRADTRLKKGIRPVFKDTTDLGVGNLDEGIKEALADSRFLIVICSPNASRSKWVNREVREFIDSGRAADIIPFIIDGEPNSSDPSRECFPEELRNLKEEHEIKAANVNEGGRNAAAVRVIARMFGLRFDELWQRYRRREMRRNILIGAIAALAIVTGLSVYDYFRVKTTFYEDYAIRYGIPEGITRLKQSELKRYPSYYKFEHTQGKLVRVTICNYWGQPTENTPDGPIFEIGYENGRLNSILHKDSHGKPIYKELYVSEDFTKVDLKESSSGDAARLFGSGTSMTEGITPENLDPLSIFSKNKSLIRRYVYEYDDNGYIIRKMFKRHNGSNEPGFDSNGISGFAFTYDNNHRLSSITYLDSEENACPNKYGIIREEIDYDTNGIAKEHRYIGTDGKLKTNEMGYAFQTTQWDPEGATSIISYFDEKGLPTITRALVHKEVSTFNKNTLTYECFGPDGERTIFYNFLIPEEGGVHKYITEYNDEGLPSSVSFYDIDGLAAYNGSKIHRIRYYYNPSNSSLLDSLMLYDIDGERKNSIQNYSKIRYSYDEKGEKSSESYFDYKNRPIYINGVHYVIPKFKNDKIVKISGFSHNMWPCPMGMYGGAYSIEIDYDSDGNAEKMRFLDGSGKPYMAPGFGYATIKAEYDNGNLSRLTTYDTNGNIVNGITGFAVRDLDWDNRGNLIKEEFLDSDMNPVCDAKGVARHERKFDNSGNCVEIRTYDADGNLIVNSDGYAICKNEYSFNRLVAQSSFDASGMPMLSPGGVHRVNYTYDNVGRLTSEKYFDKTGHPATCILGFHGKLYEYDRFGNTAIMTFIGTNGKPVNNMDGVAIQRNFFDRRNNIIKTEYLGSDIKPTVCEALGYAYYTAEYNDRGLQTEMAFYDAGGNPANCEQGYHKAISKYDDEGLPLTYYTLDADGKYADALINSTFASKLVNIFDDSNEIICTALFDQNENLTAISAFYIEDGVVKGNLSRQYPYSTATMQYPDGTTRLYDYNLFYDLDDSHTDDEIIAHRYQQYLDSIGETAKHIYDNL